MTPIRDTVATPQITDRAAGYGMRAVPVERLRSHHHLRGHPGRGQQAERLGKGPTFIEAMTYRLVGHMIGDNEVYRTKAKVAEHRTDMIGTFPQRLVSEFMLRPRSTHGRGQHHRARWLRSSHLAGEPVAEPSEIAEDVWA